MNSPFDLLRNSWQLVVNSIACDQAAPAAAPCSLQALEDRLLYDASPLGGLIVPPGESITVIESFDHQLDSLVDLCSQAQADCLFPLETRYEVSYHLDAYPDSLVDDEGIDRQLIIIDDRVNDIDQLVNDLQGADSDEVYDVVKLDPSKDGIEQVDKLFSGSQQYESVHIISHGSDGRLQLGGTELNSTTLNQYQQNLAGWSAGLTENADILLYGCEVVQTETGQQFLERFSELVGADMAASDDLTGHESLGGDWEFEYLVGQVDTEFAFTMKTVSSWHGLLSTGTAIWAENGSNLPETSSWDGSTFGTEGSAANVGQWRIMQGAEAPTRSEAIILGVDAGGTVDGQMWDGSSWSTLPMNPLGTVTQTFWWGMDVQYESQSGDALAVWTDGSSIEYATWDGTSWSSVNSLGIYTGATPRHLQLAANPATDEMVLIASDSNSRDTAYVWDGNNWGNAVTLATDSSDDRTDINVAYEQQSGHAMVVYTDNNVNLRYQMWDGTSWSGENTATAPGGVGGTVRWTSTASDPGSDRIAVGVVTSSDEAWFAVWDGSSWGNQIFAEPTTQGSTYPNATIAFESNSGDLLAVYAENGKDDLRYVTLTSGGTWSAEQKTPDKFGQNLNSMILASDPFSNDIMLVLQDEGSDVNYVLWNGVHFETPFVQEVDSGEIKNQPFLFLWDQDQAAKSVLNSTQDNYIKLKSGETGLNFGVSTQLIVDREDGDLQRSLLQFDLSSIPVGAVIHGATVQLEASAMDGLLSIDVYQLLENWDEGSGNGTADEANWINRVTGTAWATAGGSYDPTAIDSITTDLAGQHSWNITTLVQAWVDGTYANHGIMIATFDGGGSRTVTYDSREGTVAPELIIHYSIPNLLPTDISPNSVNINEHIDTSGGYSAATLTTTDPDAGDTFTYSIVGGADAGKFSIGGAGADELILTDGVLDFESQSSYSVIVRTTDAANAWYEETLTVNVNDLNDAPVYDNTGTTQLSNVLQNSTDPAGDMVSAIIASAGGDRITDVDSGAVEGIAVTAVNDTNGTWEYSVDGGSTWTAFGAVTDLSAVVLGNTPNDRIRFVPNTGYSGNASITIRAWDTTDGNSSGATGVNTTLGAAASAFSAATESVSIYVEPTEVLLWMSTTGDVGPAYSQPSSDVPGLPSWSESSVIGMGDPNLSFGNGITDGTFSLVSNFDLFAADGNTEIRGLHFVISDITISGAGISGGSLDLLADDLLFVAGQDESLTTAASGPPAGWTNNLPVTEGDIYAFRAVTPGDYSSGYFRLVTTGPGTNTTRSITLVEQAVTVGGDVVLDAGDFLFSQSGNVQHNRIYWYDTSANNSTVLIDGDDIGIEGGGSGEPIVGLELVETGAVVGGLSLGTGDILVTVNASGTVGDNNLGVKTQDVFVLDVTATTYGSGTAAATATMLFDGDGNANFDNPEESLDAISLIIQGTGTNQDPVVSNSGGPVNFIENGSPVIIDSTINVADADSADFDGGALSVQISAGGSFGDRLSIFHQGTGIGQVGVTGNDVTYNFGAGAVIIGSFTGGFEPGSTLVVSLNANTDAAATQALARNITFWNTSDNPATSARTIDFDLTDGDGGTSSTISQSATVTAQPDPPVAVNDGFGLDFDGIDDYVAIADDPSLIMTNTLTMEAWINPDASANANRMIINKEGEYEVALFSNDRIYWAFANTDPGWAWHDTGYTVTNGEWTHIAVTYDNGSVTTYVNGNVVDVYNGSGSIGDNYPLLNELRIGGRSNNPPSKYFDGQIDDVRVWDTARSQVEIQNNLDNVLTGGEAGLAGHWSFSEGFGATTADTTANGNDGTLIDGGAGTAGPQWTGYVTDENTPLVINAASGIVSNDIDIDGDALTVTQVNGSGANVGSTFGLPSGANLTVNAGGDFTYDPNGAFEYLDSGQRVTDTFMYQVDDGNGGTETATVTVTITGVNDAPTVATNTGTTVLEGSAGNVISSTMLDEGDSDDDAAELVYRITNVTDNGTMVLAGFGALGLNDTFTQAQIDAGDVTYDHNDSETTSDAFGFSLADGGEDGSTPVTGTFNITVTPVNESPTDIAPNSFAVDENTDTSSGFSIGTLSASDPDLGESFTWSIVGGADAAVFSIGGAGSDELTLTDGVLNFETQSSYSVIVRVTDSGGLTYDETLTVSVNDLNDAPTDIAPNSFAVDENTDTSSGLSLGTLTATDQDGGETFSYSIVGGADAASFSIGGAGADELILTDGALDFETQSSYSVIVRVTDSGGNTYDETLTVNVNDLNETPTDIAPNSFAVDENTDTSSGFSLGTLTATDEDGGETFSYSIVGGADAASFSIGGAGSDELNLNDGVLDFETQSSYSVIVRVTDSGGNTYDETLTVNVNDLNATPTDIAPNSFAVDENTDTSGGFSLGTLTATDEDGGETFTWSINGGADAASFSIGGAGSDELILTDGVLDFETQSSYSVTVRVTDSGGLTYDETLTINVNDINDPPTDIAPNSFAVDENTDTSSGFSLGTLTASDEDGGETFTYSINGGADAASFSIGGAASDELILTDGVLDFETQSSYSVIVRVTDSGGNTYDETLTFDVNDLNETPTDIAPNSFAIAENTDTSSGFSLGTLTATDEDSGETFSYSIVGGADAGSFSIGGAGADELILTDGMLDFETQSTYSVIVRVTDSGGNTYDETLTVNVSDLNETPVINDQGFGVNENSPNGTSVGFALASDVDAGDSVTYSITGGTGASAFAVDSVTGEITVADLSQLDFETTSSFTLTVEVTDTGGLTDSATITINLNDINDEQTIVTNVPLNVNEGAAGLINGSLLETTDQDDGPASLVYSVASAPVNGTILVNGIPTLTFSQDDIDNGRITYLHDGSQTSFDSFDFTVDDGLGAVSSGTFVIAVSPVNNAPIASDDSFTVDEGDTHNGPSSNLLANDFDTEGDTLTASLITGPVNGMLTLNPDGSFTYTHDGSETTTDSFQYRVNDGVFDSNVATVTINVTPVNDAPIGAADHYATPAGLVLNELVGVLANDLDAEASPIIAILAASPANGTVLLNANGSFTYIPDDGFYGTDSFSYLPNDGSLSGNLTTVNIDVAAVPAPTVEPPVEPTFDAPLDPPTETEDPLDPVETESESREATEEVTESISAVLVGAIRETSVDNAIEDFNQFESADEIREYIEMLTDRQQAEAVLRMIVANAAPEVIHDSEEIRQLRLESGIGVAFDASYLWEQMDNLERDPDLLVNFQMTVGTVTAIGTMGYLFWSLRGGVLVAAALSHFPTWRMIDPLPVLDSYAAQNGKSEEDDFEEYFD